MGYRRVTKGRACAVGMYRRADISEGRGLKGLSATTHHNAISLLKEIAPDAFVYEDKRFVDNGRIILSAGISAGIDMSVYAVAKLLGEKQARETAYHMEYDWEPGVLSA